MKFTLILATMLFCMAETAKAQTRNNLDQMLGVASPNITINRCVERDNDEHWSSFPAWSLCTIDNQYFPVR